MAHPSSSSLLSLIPTAVSGGGASTLAGKTARQTFARVENPDIKVVREAPPPAGNSNSIGGSSTSNKNEEGGLSRHQGRSKTSETTSLLKSPNRSGPLGQASEEQHQLSDMSMLHIHPQTPPVPMEHPSHVLPSHSGLSRQRTVSGASSQYSMMSGSALVQNRPEQAHPTLGLVSHPQRKKSSLQKKAQTVRAPRKEGRVASVGSASLPAHGPSGSHMPSMERSRSQPLMGSAHHPQGGMASQRLADGLDPRRVMDPRSRAILDLEPIHDAHLLRLSSQHASRRTLQPLVENKSSSSKPHPPSVLQEPAINSTQLLHHKIQLVRQTKFDPVNAMAQYMSNKESLKAVQDRVTAKSLNAPRTAVERYSDLPSLIDSFQHKHGGLVTHQTAAALQKPASAIPRPRTLPRAKKSTSQAWIESLECRPDLEEFRLSRLEVDTICLPFPQLVDHPLDPGPGNPILSPSSIDINYEDSRRWIHYETPVTIDDI